jgi:hypothetical protein
MSFNDVWRRKTYAEFMHEAKTTAPYRGADRVVRYPLGKRAYSNRYWTKEENRVGIFYKDCVLGYVHPDDTFEFRMTPGRTAYDQGEALMLGSFLPVWVMSNASQGGCICIRKQRNEGETYKDHKRYPVFEGLRIRLSDGYIADDQTYEIHTNVLNRKATKPVREPYEKMFKLAETMIRGMGAEAIVREMKERMNGQITPAIAWQSTDLSEAFDPNDPAGACILLALRYAYADMAHHIGWNEQRAVRHLEWRLNGFVKYIAKVFYDELYTHAINEGKEIFSVKVTGPKDKLTSNKWGQKVFVNGVECKRYR